MLINNDQIGKIPKAMAIKIQSPANKYSPVNTFKLSGIFR